LSNMYFRNKIKIPTEIDTNVSNSVYLLIANMSMIWLYLSSL